MVMKIRSVLIFALISTFSLTWLSASSRIHRVEAQGFFGAQREPSIDVDKKNKLYLMMSVATGVPPSPHSQIFFTRSVDGGATWDNTPTTRNLSNSPREDFNPSLAVTKSGKVRVYTVFHDNLGSGVYLIKSKKGVKFKAPARVPPDEGGRFNPRLALDSNESLNIAWGEIHDLHRRVMYVRSTDLGESFTDPVDISRSSGEAFQPEIAVDPSNAINIVWEDTAPGASAIMYSRSTDGGATFSSPAQLSKGAAAAAEAHIAADGSGGLNVAWVGETDDGLQVFFTRSTDGGATFSEPTKLTGDAGADIHKVFVTTFQQTIYISYNDDQSKLRQVYLLTSTDAGQSFSSPEQISNADRSRGRAHSSSMVVDKKGKLHIVWIDSSIIGSDEGLLFYRNSKDGHSFSQPKMLLAII